jgi:hypothetical protein
MNRLREKKRALKFVIKAVRHAIGINSQHGMEKDNGYSINNGNGYMHNADHDISQPLPYIPSPLGDPYGDHPGSDLYEARKAKTSGEESGRPSLPIEKIQLHPRRMAIECGICNGTKELIYLHEEYWGEKVIIEADKMVGYRCTMCEIETPDIDATVEFLTKALQIAKAKKDSFAVQDLGEELAIAQRQQERAHSPAA